MARDLGTYLWGLNLNGDTSAYREYTPFSTRAPILGPFQAVVRGCDLRYDERFPLKDDYDFALQRLNRYRCTLRHPQVDPEGITRRQAADAAVIAWRLQQGGTNDERSRGVWEEWAKSNGLTQS